MNPEQTQLLRKVALQDQQALSEVLGGGRGLLQSLDEKGAALVRIAALVSLDSDPSTFRWAVDQGVAAGLEDDAIFDALMVIAPVIGAARFTSTLPLLLNALDIEIVEG